MLNELRVLILSNSPEAAEKISRGMATFVLSGNLVHFAAQKKHIGFHPGPSAIVQFQEELSAYHTSKGTVQFPYSDTLPCDLIQRMVMFRVKEQSK